MFHIHCIISLLLTLLSGIFPAYASERWTFDGEISNNTLAMSPDETIIVAGNSANSDLLVYDLKTNTLRTRLSGYITPRNIVFAPDGRVFYVSDSSLGVVTKIDSRTFKKLGEFNIGPGAFGTAISQNGKTLYVNNQAAHTVTALDLQTQHPQKVIPNFSQPRQGIRLSPSGDTLFVTNFLSDTITLVDTKTNEIKGEIKGFNKIRAIAISGDGKTLFAANSGANNIAVVDISSKKIKKFIAVGKEPYGAALTPDGQFIYTGNRADNSLSVIALPALEVIATIPGFNQPRQAIVFTKDSKTAYVLNEDLSVAQVDLASNRIAKIIKHTGHP